MRQITNFSWGLFSSVILIFLASLQIVIAVCPDGMSGNGNITNPCQIVNWTNLQAIEDNLSMNYSLMNDINESTDGYSLYQTGTGFLPIGDNLNGFSGNFEGNNHTITNIYINKSSNYAGLFGRALNSNMTNIGLINVSINGTSQIGGLVGDSSNVNIDRCFVTGKIISKVTSGNANMGGIAGQISNTQITNSYSIAEVIGLANSIGGLIGYMDQNSNIIISYSIGNVTGDEKIGGLVGYLGVINSDILKSFSTGTVKGANQTGGILGNNSGGAAGSVANSYWDQCRTNQTVCVGVGGTGIGVCTEVNNLTNRSTNYFYNLDNEPMNTFFTGVSWNNICNNTGYPILTGFNGQTCVNKDDLCGSPPTTPSVDSSHEKGEYSNNNTVYFNWSSTDPDLGIVKYTFVLDQNNDTELSTALSLKTNKTYTNLPDGNYWFHVKAYDDDGDTSNTTHYNVKINQAGGDITIFSPGNYVNSSVDISGLTNSDIGNVTVKLHSNGTSLLGTLTNVEGGFTFTNINLGVEGTYLIWTNATDNASTEYKSNVITVTFDETPPEVTVISPGGNLGAGSVPFISVVTDEKAYCEYEDSGYKPFQVTNNTKYHETIIESVSGSETFNIRCFDLAGNQDTDSESVSYTAGTCTVSNIIFDQTPTGYAGETITFNVSGIGCAAIHYSKFKLTLDDEIMDVSARHIDSGKYQIQFRAPQTQGDYIVKLEVDGITESSTLDTTDSINLKITYDGAGLTSGTDHLIYSKNSQRTVGIASDSNDVSTSNAYLEANPMDGSLYIFVTEPDAKVEKREQNLERKDFREYQNPSFGYNLRTGKYPVQATIAYENIEIEGDDVLYDGTYTVLIKNKGINSTTGKVMVEIKLI